MTRSPVLALLLRSRLTLALLVAAACAICARPAASRGAGATLAEGGLPSRRHAAGAVRAVPELPDAALQRLESSDLRLGAGETPLRPKAFGDRLRVSLDDGATAPIHDTWEARLDVSGGPAGPSDAIAVRFPQRSLAAAPPFRISDVVLGLDDLHGATTWPVELRLEDAGSPLDPRGGGASAQATLDAVAAGLAPLGPAWRPSAFLRLPVGLSLDVPDAWLGDGSFDDDFARSNGPLDDGLSDWLECQGPLCGPDRLQPVEVEIAAGRAERTGTGSPLLLVKFQDPAVFAVREALDLDLSASVALTIPSPAGRAGLALRVMAVDAYYRVEWIPAASRVEVVAVTPGGDRPLGGWAVPAGSGTRVLEATASGAGPAVAIAVRLDGAPLGTVTDAQYRLTGTLVGLVAAGAAGAGEAWDDLVVRRRPDAFVVVGVPAGQDVGLPLDLSDDSLVSQSVLVSSDGTTFAPRSAGPGCAHAGNPFVQLEVEETDAAGGHLFEREAHVVSVAVACDTCPTGPRDCAADASLAPALRTQPTEDQPHAVDVAWWNAHLADAELLFRATAWTGPCDARGTVVAQMVASASSAGQAGSPDAVSRVRAGTFTPADPGPYCIVVDELHDANGDCCPDGAETMPLLPCGPACVPVAASDSNPSTAVVLRDLLVAPACAPLVADAGRDGPDDLDADGDLDEINLDGGSLRVARGAGDDVVLTWGVVDPLVFPATYNLHRLRAQPFEAGACMREVMPVVERPVGVLARTATVVLAPGQAEWFAVFETDGCDADASVPDSSADDPAAGAACP